MKHRKNGENMVIKCYNIIVQKESNPQNVGILLLRIEFATQRQIPFPIPNSVHDLFLRTWLTVDHHR